MHEWKLVYVRISMLFTHEQQMPHLFESSFSNKEISFTSGNGKNAFQAQSPQA